MPPPATPTSTSGVRAIEPLNAQEDAILRAFARILTALPRALDADMVREQHISLSEYLVLMHLSEAPDNTLRMSELASACDMSLSGMSRLAGKLEAEGLLERIRCVSDGRGFNAVLTNAGLARLEQAWPTNLASARRHIFDHLGGVDLDELARVLRAIAT